MQVQDLRIAMFSGNYNYVRDGANQALNRLVGYLLKSGAAVRIYAPVIPHPAFPPTGDLVGTPSFPVPGRGEYRLSTGISTTVRRDLDAFKPNLVHVSAPDILGHSAVRYGRRHHLPIIASMHTRFDTYFRYYGMPWLEPVARTLMRHFYRRCDAVAAPSESTAEVLRAQRMGDDIGIWSRGIDRSIFSPAKRDDAWRQAQAFTPDDVVIGYFGRLVMEKGLDVFAATLERLRQGNVAHKILIIGDGPARQWFADRLPTAVFTGFMAGQELGRAAASMDVLFNPSVTEAFGNVTSEVMACGVPVVAARATGSANLISDGTNGRLITAGDIDGYAAALALYCCDNALRQAHGAAAEQAVACYDWDVVNQVLVDTYLRVMTAHQARANAMHG